MAISLQFLIHVPLFAALALAGVAQVLVGCAKTEEASVRAIAPTSSRQWALNVGGVGSDSVDALAIDMAGNIIVGGTFEDEMTLGSATHASAGGKDIYIGKFTSSGYCLWSKSYGSELNDQITSLVTDKAGFTYVAGNFLAPLELGSGLLTPVGGSDIFVVKLDGAGATVWSKAFGGEGLDGDARLALDADGNLVVAGAFSQTIAIGASNLTSAGQTDVFIARLAALDGTATSAHRLGGVEAESASFLEVASSDLAVLGGTFSGTLPLAASPLISRGDGDALLLKYNANAR